jgi:hypothetical protein
MTNKHSLEQLLLMIEMPRRDACHAILKKFEHDMSSLPGSQTKHQAWEGGYLDHVLEAMNIAVVLYHALSAKRELEFSLSDALFGAFLHDLDKIFRYREPNSSSPKHHLDTIIDELEQQQIRLTDAELNTLKYCHGEGTDYHPTKRIMLPLTTFVHCCDVISARIWFDKGRDHRRW